MLPYLQCAEFKISPSFHGEKRKKTLKKKVGHPVFLRGVSSFRWKIQRNIERTLSTLPISLTTHPQWFIIYIPAVGWCSNYWIFCLREHSTSYGVVKLDGSFLECVPIFQHNYYTLMWSIAQFLSLPHPLNASSGKL